MGIIQSSVAEHASPSQWALMTGLGISVTRLWSEDLAGGEGKFQQSCSGYMAGDGERRGTLSRITGSTASKQECQT